MKTKTLETRSAAEADEDFVWSVYRDAVRPHIEPRLSSGWDDAKERVNFLGLFKACDAHIISLDGAPIGWVGGTDDGKTVVVEHLYVTAAYRGLGYGRRVFEGLLSQWNQAGKTVEASVLKNVRAKAALQGLGFTQVSDDDLTEVLRFK